jgi:hypothetical protein
VGDGQGALAVQVTEARTAQPVDTGRGV